MRLDLEPAAAHEIAAGLWVQFKALSRRVQTLRGRYGDTADVLKLERRVLLIDRLIRKFEDAGHFQRHVHQSRRD